MSPPLREVAQRSKWLCRCKALDISGVAPRLDSTDSVALFGTLPRKRCRAARPAITCARTRLRTASIFLGSGRRARRAMSSRLPALRRAYWRSSHWVPVGTSEPRYCPERSSRGRIGGASEPSRPPPLGTFPRALSLRRLVGHVRYPPEVTGIEGSPRWRPAWRWRPRPARAGKAGRKPPVGDRLTARGPLEDPRWERNPARDCVAAGSEATTRSPATDVLSPPSGSLLLASVGPGAPRPELPGRRGTFVPGRRDMTDPILLGS